MVCLLDGGSFPSVVCCNSARHRYWFVVRPSCFWGGRAETVASMVNSIGKHKFHAGLKPEEKADLIKALQKACTFCCYGGRWCQRCSCTAAACIFAGGSLS
ncbi:hypothetical protein KP509_02G051500 [Ceratopteris richardii]|uniref:Uncharacterized protein n=1 Tax=Ceratopteris richardii TaxID=49495 RepID=A0A8T2V8U3_CERRI|nr:hypothetical protein KP509_02G051500 [Ceratopteris richardii]